MNNSSKTFLQPRAHNDGFDLSAGNGSKGLIAQNQKKMLLKIYIKKRGGGREEWLI